MRRYLGSILCLTLALGAIGCTTCDVCDDCGIKDDPNYGVMRRPRCGHCGAKVVEPAHVSVAMPAKARVEAAK